MSYTLASFGRLAMSTIRPTRSGPSLPTSFKFKVRRGDQDIANALSAQFRAGSIYAYSFEKGVWSTWATEADWAATERGGTIRDQAAADAGHGPTDWDRDKLVAELGLNVTTFKARKPGKAEFVSLLRRMRDGVEWDVDEIDALLAREAA